MGGNVAFGITLKSDDQASAAIGRFVSVLQAAGKDGSQAMQQIAEGAKKGREGIESAMAAADPRALMGVFAQAKKSAADLAIEFKLAQQTVNGLANSMRATPGDAGIARDFESAKKNAKSLHEELKAGQQFVELSRRGLAAQGMEVGNLAESYRRLKQEVQLSSRLASTPNTNSPSVAPRNITNAIVSTSAVNEVDSLGGRIDALSGKLAQMGHLSAAFFITQSIAGYMSEIGKLSDSYVSLNAQLKLATDKHGSLSQAQSDVLRISTESASAIKETAMLYSRLSSSVTKLGFDQRAVANVTEVVGLSLKVSGASAAESSSAILQLSQAFGSGVLRGEEFNAVNEASPRLMQALADGIGRPKEELRKLAENGQLSSKVLALALPQALGQLRAEAAQMPLTIGQSFTLLENKMTLFIGKINDGTGAFSGFASAVKLLADNLDIALTAGAAAAALAATKVTQGVLTQRAIQREAHIANLAEIAERTAADSAANKAALSGLARLGVVQQEIIAGNAAASAASSGAMATAGTAARGLLGVLGGPVGIVATIGMAAAAWMAFGRESNTALDLAIRKSQELDAAQNKTGIKAPGQSREVVELAQMEKDLATKKASLTEAEGRIRQSAAGGPSLTTLLFGQDKLDVARLRAEVSAGEDVIKQARSALKKQQEDDATRPQAIQDALADGQKKKKTGSKADPFDTLIQQANGRIAALQAEARENDKLTESEKQLAMFEEKMAQGKTGLKEAQIASAHAKLQEVVVAEQLAQAHRNELAARDAALKKVQEETTSLRQKLEATQRETEQVGLSKDELAQLTVKRDQDALAAMQGKLAVLDAAGACTQETEALREQVKVRRDLTAAAAELAKKQENQRMADSAKKVIGQVDPTAGYEEQRKELEKLRQTVNPQTGKTFIDEKQYQAALESIGRKGTDTFAQLTQATQGWGKQFTDSMTQMMTTGKFNFSNLATSIVNDLMRIAVQTQITQPLLDALFSKKGAGGGGGGMFSGLLDVGMSFISGLFNANGNAFTGHGVAAFANGGTFGGTFTNQLFSSPTAFKFAAGGGFNLGVMGEAGPEAVMPLTRTSGGQLGVRAQVAGSASTSATASPIAITVNVINAPAGTQVAQTRTTQDGNGGMTLDVILEQVENTLARNVTRGNGQLSSSLENTYGLNRAAGAQR